MAILEGEYAPIWKDHIVTLGSGASADYIISCEGMTIYTGKAHKKPDADSITVRINDVCADFLENVIPNLSQAEFDALTFPLMFRTSLYYADYPNVIKDEVYFLNDWSYDYGYDAAVDGMAFPINGKVDVNQWVVWTGFDVSTVEATITFIDGTSTQVFIPVELSADFNADFNSDFAREARSAASGTAVFKPSAWSNVKSITINGVTYDVVQSCNRYALYYVNAHGGWDSLLIEGNHTEVDNLTRFTRDVEYDNRNVQNRSRFNYVNTISKSMILHTSWMNDDESSRMHHLLNSTNVYLYDLVTEEMIPVVLTNTSTEYKTYKSNGCKLVNYAIELAFANDRIRR